MSILLSRSVCSADKVSSVSRPPPHDCIINPRFPEVLSILAGERENFED